MLRVKRHTFGYPDGLTKCEFMEGETISPSDPRLSERLMGAGLRDGWLEQVVEKAIEMPPENKALGPPANKSVKKYVRRKK